MIQHITQIVQITTQLPPSVLFIPKEKGLQSRSDLVFAARLAKVNRQSVAGPWVLCVRCFWGDWTLPPQLCCRVLRAVTVCQGERFGTSPPCSAPSYSTALPGRVPPFCVWHRGPSSSAVLFGWVLPFCAIHPHVPLQALLSSPKWAP
ncbi:UNVERIFIED_CONTAM: hypothetical protein FKN15_005456 [Acipenser sinensis]